eukprot:SAG31_NODE_65_length_28565_cov_8.402914_33_plen_132_part_00
MLLSRFCATIREMRDFNREIYGTNRESVCINRLQVAWANRAARKVAVATAERAERAQYGQLSPTQQLLLEADIDDATLGTTSIQHGRRSGSLARPRAKWQSPYAAIKNSQRTEAEGLAAVRREGVQSLVGL